MGDVGGRVGAALWALALATFEEGLAKAGCDVTSVEILSSVFLAAWPPTLRTSALLLEILAMTRAVFIGFISITGGASERLMALKQQHSFSSPCTNGASSAYSVVTHREQQRQQEHCE